jgi:uncharacterized membrane protein
MLTGPTILVTLKILVSLVTVLFAGSLVALAMRKKKLHGQINTVFFLLTMLTVVVFEVLIRFVVDVTTTFSPEARQALRVHLCFSIPAAILLPVMLFTGRRTRLRSSRLHIALGVVFLILWISTAWTGIVNLPID